ncbi:MAG TPA: chemotaxis protein CheB [Chitinophagaceae bacterium]|nr:chemotaxis protein CheB [Chitinophagaceae bacterium]
MESYNEPLQEPRYIIVVGASAGGLNALTELTSQLNPDIDAAIFIVLHLSRTGISDFLAHRLQQFTSLHCVIAADGGSIHKGHIYIARPNYHLIVKDGKTIIGRGPTENRWRPSIDVLFRSAAVQYDGRVIGIILTGLMDDGMSGMQAIRRSGGKCIVQDPNQAEYPDMPLAVLNSMEVDHCAPLQEMGKLITDITSNKNVQQTEIPQDLRIEAEISQRVAIGIDVVSNLGEQSVYTCPDCGGGLWRIMNNSTDRYRCYTGHLFSERDLVIKQADQIEGTFWVALRMMEERRNLLIKMEMDARQRGFNRIALEHHSKLKDLEEHITKLKDLLFAVQTNEDM